MTERTPYFPKFEKPVRLKRMRVADAGHLPGGSKGIRFHCPHCGYDTDWISVLSIQMATLEARAATSQDRT